MRFHISSHHTPEFCGLGNPGKFPPNPSWPERCKELGIEYVIGGGCQPDMRHAVQIDRVQYWMEMGIPVFAAPTD